jgi:hypothetical protein
VKRIIDEQLDRTRNILESRRSALDAIAKSLIELEVIDGSQLKEIIEKANPAPMLVPGTDAERKPVPKPTLPLGDAEVAEG